MVFRKNITEVFTPRNSNVNNGMYISRLTHEKSLIRSINGSMHTFLYGESGNGKSWLYKRTFSEAKLNYVVVNCANASRKGSITNEIVSVCNRSAKPQETEVVKTQKVGASLVGKAEISHQTKYKLQEEDSLLEAFREVSVSKDKTIIVLDNVETILDNNELMSELSDIIILLDDPAYALFRVKFLIVGVPYEVFKYFRTAKNATSVGNRIEELPRLSGLGTLHVSELVKRGFNNYLKLNLQDAELKKIGSHSFNVTFGIPQRVHEYCECLAYEIEDNGWKYTPALLEQAESSWLLKGLRESYSIIEGHLNSVETVDGRRNQVIYAIGQHSNNKINTDVIGDIVAKEFPLSSPSNKSGIGQVLAYLSKGKTPLLHKIEHSKSYAVCDVRHLMCIRIMLYKNKVTEIVKKKGFKYN